MKWKVHRNRFVHVEYEQLHMDDISHLKQEYDNLAQTCEALLKEREERLKLLDSIRLTTLGGGSDSIDGNKTNGSSELNQGSLLLDFFI